MSNDRLKFRQPYFLRDGKFSHWHYWGWMSEGEFVGPLSLGHNVKGEMVQQWTGLYDIEGVEIYEGDIVSIEEGGEWCMDSITNAAVEWDCIGWSPWTSVSCQIDVSYIYSSDGKNIKVNGNIYENPELLDA